MLVLARKVGDKIVIQTDPPVYLVVVGIQGDKVVRLGLEAPEAVRIVREELVERECHA